MSAIAVIRSHHSASRSYRWLLAVGVVAGALLLGVIRSSAAHAAPALNFTSFVAGDFNADGTPSTQAGAVPYEYLTSFVFGTVLDPRVNIQVPAASLKTPILDVPPGVVGNPTLMPQCRQDQLNSIVGIGTGCPAETQIGVADVDVGFYFNRTINHVGIYNMVPPPGVPAQFGFLVVAAVAHIDISVRSDGDYGVTATVHNTNGTAPIYSVKLHLWGVPADPSHDFDRFPAGSGPSGSPLPSQLSRTAFLRNPTSCAGPLTAVMNATSWQEPDQPTTALSTTAATTGCANVPFAPTVKVTPDERRAGQPAGFGIDVNLPQDDSPDGLATADLKRAVVTLPAGVAINPSSADGLLGCDDADFGLHSLNPEQCPDGSKIGTTTITTPLLDKPLTGSVYLGKPLEQGPVAASAGRMFRLFFTAQGSGVRIKLAGSVVPDPVTGQLTTTVDNNPQLPFSDFHVQLTGGSRAPLSLPKACGTYTTTAVLTPWTAPAAPSVTTSDSFTVDQNCDEAGKFEPTFDAGLVTPSAGGSSAFVLNAGRPDGQQDITGLSVSLPPGLLAHVGSVPLCSESDANAGTCPAASQIGHTAVASGLGSSPLYVPQPGKSPTGVYLAGPYHGAPYSLSVVVPAQAGPFDLGRVVVRAALSVDSSDAHVTVTSDPIPTILLGVPLSVQKINVLIDRPGFMANPTNCSAMSIASKVSSASAAVQASTPFRVAGCTSLKFAPKFSASTAGVARPNRTGASLHVKLATHEGITTNGSAEADLKRVEVQLPKDLPSRLTTLQKACTAAQFAANLANCPEASFVGTATAHTPLLSSPLTGPAILVSHGGAAFPDLVIVLQGGGIRLDLVGNTTIKGGITYSKFEMVPDAPVSAFELDLPQSPHSALSASSVRGFCGLRKTVTTHRLVSRRVQGRTVHVKQTVKRSVAAQLVMPTMMEAQNGAVTRQNTVIAVTGCPATKAKSAAAAHVKQSKRTGSASNNRRARS